jgi:uridine monophosphate synthetase
VLQNEGLLVSDVVVLIDREQGGEAHLAANGLKLHAAFKLSFLLDVLVKHGCVGTEVAAKVRQFISDNQTKLPEAGAQPAAPAKPARMTYEQRATLAQNAMAKQCFEIMVGSSTGRNMHCHDACLV